LVEGLFDLFFLVFFPQGGKYWQDHNMEEGGSTVTKGIHHIQHCFSGRPSRNMGVWVGGGMMMM